MTFPIICRVCKGDSVLMSSIYSSLSFAERSIEIQEVIKTCASVQIEKSDGLPQKICSKCVSDLRAAYLFKKLCEKSDCELRLNLKWTEIRKGERLFLDVVGLQRPQEQDLPREATSVMNCVNGMNFNELKEIFFVKTPIVPAASAPSHDFEIRPNYNRIRTYRAKTVKASTQVEPSTDAEAEVFSDTQASVFNCVEIKEEIKVESEDNLVNIQPILISKDKFSIPIQNVSTENLNNNYNSKVTETQVKIEPEELLNSNTESDNEGVNDDLNERNMADCCKTLTLRNLLQNNSKPQKKRGKILRCRFCDEIHPNRRSLANHQKLHAKIYGCFCGRAFRTFSRFLDHKKLHKRRFKCEICEASYLSKSRLKIHIRNHTGDTPFVCDVCNRGFIRSYSLRIHKMEHTGEKPFGCELCPKRFTQRSLLKKHAKTHTGEKPFECELCRMRFSRNFHLQRHVLRHSGRKPDVSEMKFQCEFCGKKFFEKRHLRSHRVVHTGERPYKCDVCGKDFAQSSTLSTHKRVHTGEKRYKCDVCNKRYSQKGYLTGHMRIHTGEKPYKCEVCGKFFRLPGHLSTHLKSHSGEKPYQCEVCEKRFTLPSHLRAHKLIHDREITTKAKE